jgi:hypothetical protein
MTFTLYKFYYTEPTIGRTKKDPIGHMDPYIGIYYRGKKRKEKNPIVNSSREK